ncbi:hypothetical protein BB560_005576 [Smittium megazygosporum]|uniref:HIG1 domain-containing protein n=1 Tax=Smittium megazygosporum TaxID=133381 RepID=A0A2T9Z2X8_9FUNG|nr:hypothetical protein BB560_005576 [Smittium megazygosporum]
MVKILTEEEEKRIDRLIINNTIIGATTGALVGLTGVFLLNKTWPFFKRLPIGIKGSLVGACSIGAMTIRAEGQNIQYERALYGNGSEEEEPAKVAKLTAPGGQMDSAVDFFLQHKYKILFGLWAAAASASVYKLYLNKNISWTQRLVQARMYAQALTIAALLGVTVLTTAFTDEEKEREAKMPHTSF